MPVLHVRPVTSSEAAATREGCHLCPVYTNSQRANVYSPMVATFTLRCGPDGAVGEDDDAEGGEGGGDAGQAAARGASATGEQEREPALGSEEEGAGGSNAGGGGASARGTDKWVLAGVALLLQDELA